MFNFTTGQALLANRQPWTNVERNAVHRYLGSFIQRKVIPGKSDIEILLEAEPHINRTWRNIKDYCRNLYQTNHKDLIEEADNNDDNDANPKASHTHSTRISYKIDKKELSLTRGTIQFLLHVLC